MASFGALYLGDIMLLFLMLTAIPVGLLAGHKLLLLVLG